MAHFRKTRVIIIFVTLFAFSCNDTTKTNRVIQNKTQEKKPFDTFLIKFNKVSLPLTIKACNIKGGQLHELTPEQDNPFVTDRSLAYQTFKTNGNYIATVSLGLADCLLPILTTYDLNGKTIDEKTIAIGYCGSDCGYSCEEFMSIKPDFTIYTADAISSSECDSLGNIIPETTENYIIYKTGRLLSNGKIELSEEIKEPLTK